MLSLRRRDSFCVWLIVPALCLASSVKAQCSTSAVAVSEPCSVDCGLAQCMSTLQDAIDYVSTTSVNSSGLDCDRVVIQIPDGQHYITNPTHFGNKSVHFNGSGDSVTVLCDYFVNETISTDLTSLHTWYFEYSKSIELRSIHFRGCGFPIRLYAIRHIQIHNCTFRYFTQAVLDIFNCQNVSVTDILVEHNRGTGLVLEAFRGNTGGVAIGYNNLPLEYIDPSMRVSNSVFVNNSALGFLVPERALSVLSFPGRGGGLGIFVNENRHNLSVEISGCVFERNFAQLFGGGVFLFIFSPANDQHFAMIENCEVISNTALLGGGGIQLTYPLALTGRSDSPNTIQVKDCNFIRNRGASGGGLHLTTGNDAMASLLQVMRCNFTENEGVDSRLDLGSAIAMTLLTIFNQTRTLPRHEVIDCYFVRNSGRNGIVTIGYAPVRFIGENHFINNTGSCLQIIGSLVEIGGHTKFINNTAIGKGVVYMLSFAQIRVMRGLRMEFEGNYGQLGASIVVGAPTSLSTFSKVLFNPQCFVLYEDRITPPTQWNDVTVTFQYNSAFVASAVYVSSVGTCTWLKNFPPFFNDSFIPDWPIWKYINNSNTGYIDPLNQQYSFGTKAEKLSTNISSVSAWPGQKVTIPLTGLDQFNHSTSANARFFRTSNNTGSNAILFDPEIVVLAGNGQDNGVLLDTFQLSFGTVADNLSVVSRVEPTDLGDISIQDPFNLIPVVADSFTLRALSCPGGYQLTQSSSSGPAYCTCVDSPKIVNCENDQDSVILKSELWAGYTPLRQPNLFFYPCPAGYCRCTFNSSLNSTCVYKYTESDRDLQCHTAREGILCGRCRDGHGVSVLLERCVTCSDAYGILIFLLIAADIGVFISITVLDLPIPGWLYPFLFYSQLAPYVSQLYPESFGEVGKYLYYFSSGTSFYFIYDFCLFKNLSTQVSYALRYLPACVAAVVFTLVLSIRKYVFKRKSLHNHGYWWFVLLSFSLVVHTSLSILNCPSIPDEDGSTALRWFINGELKCFKGGHLFLTLAALSVLVFCVFLIVIGIVIPIAKPRRFTKRFISPLTVNYRKEVKWWSGVELGRRFLFLLFFIYFPRNTVYVILVLVVIIAVYGYVQPYKSRVANILELVVQVNFLIFMLLEATTFVKESLFKFPSSLHSTKDTPQSISFLSWLLLPFYYFPLLLLIIVGCKYTVFYLKKRFCQRTSLQEETENVEVHCDVEPSQAATTQFLDIDYEKSVGEADLVELEDCATTMVNS